MLKRINISLFQPTKIAFFLKDKLSYIFLYIALLSFMASVPAILRLGLVKTMPKDVQEELISAFIRADFKGVITSGKLSSTDISKMEYSTITFKINEAPKSGYQVIFEETDMNFYFGNLLLRSYSYEALGITDFNFDLNVLENQAMFKDVTNDLYQDVKPYVVISATIFMTGANALLYVTLALIMAFFYGLRLEKLKFRFRFMMATYALSSYFIVILIGELYGLGFLSYFALILPYIYMGIAFKGLLSMSKIVVIKENDKEEED